MLEISQLNVRDQVRFYEISDQLVTLIETQSIMLFQQFFLMIKFSVFSNIFVMLLLCFFLDFGHLYGQFTEQNNIQWDLGAPPHAKFRSRLKFSISTWVEKNWCHTWFSTRGEMSIFSLHFTPPGGAKICGIFCKDVYGKRRFVCSYRII